MEQRQSIYETTFIVNAAFEDTQIDLIIEKVKDVIVKNGGDIRSMEKWGRKRLAYTIQKKNNGFYAFFEFKAPGSIVAKLERYYQLDEQIVRYLTIKLDKKALKAKQLAISKASAAVAEEAPAPVAATATAAAPAAATEPAAK